MFSVRQFLLYCICVVCYVSYRLQCYLRSSQKLQTLSVSSKILNKFGYKASVSGHNSWVVLSMPILGYQHVVFIFEDISKKDWSKGDLLKSYLMSWRWHTMPFIGVWAWMIQGWIWATKKMFCSTELMVCICISWWEGIHIKLLFWTWFSEKSKHSDSTIQDRYLGTPIWAAFWWTGTLTVVEIDRWGLYGKEEAAAQTSQVGFLRSGEVVQGMSFLRSSQKDCGLLWVWSLTLSESWLEASLRWWTLSWWNLKVVGQGYCSLAQRSSGLLKHWGCWTVNVRSIDQMKNIHSC